MTETLDQASTKAADRKAQAESSPRRHTPLPSPHAGASSSPSGQAGQGWPFATVGAARTLLDLDEDDICRLIEDGRIAWAFNICASNKARRKELRILPVALADYKAQRPCQITWAQVLRQALPSNAAEFPCVRVGHVLNCSNTQVIALVKARLLKVVRPWRRGARGAAMITRDSFIRFLQHRRWPSLLSRC
jgi:hypothetical protein